jgi:predicted Mrr-cat superfamily restriction endonuclease
VQPLASRDAGLPHTPYSRKVRQRQQHQPSTRTGNCVTDGLSDSPYGADQGLLVAWGGLSKPARDSLKNQQMRVRVWEASDVVDAVLRNYDRLPEEIRNQLPPIGAHDSVQLRHDW